MFILNSNGDTTKKPFGFLWYEFIYLNEKCHISAHV